MKMDKLYAIAVRPIDDDDRVSIIVKAVVIGYRPLKSERTIADKYKAAVAYIRADRDRRVSGEWREALQI